MQTKAQIAKEYFLQGYNCAQSVMLAFAPDFNLDKETALRISSSFGGGVGGQREVCGAISAAVMIAGLKYGYTDPKDHEKKAALYKKIQKLSTAFKEEYGSIICRDLLALNKNTPAPQKRTPEYYKNRPCANFVYSAAKNLEDYFNQNK